MSKAFPRRRHLLIVPTMACPAGCSYCFGSRQARPMMDETAIDAVVRWQRQRLDGAEIEITFHGGEPLLMGAEFYREALARLRSGLAPAEVNFAIQSNLWNLSAEFCEVFDEFEVSIGTSLDGPEAINDSQRGAGYFRKTLAGIDLARKQGLRVGCIATFTQHSAGHAHEVLDFFLGEGLPFTIHAAVPSLHGGPTGGWPLSPEAHGELLESMLDRYLAALPGARIATIDSMARSVAKGRGSICTFDECLGQYLSVGPDGSIYPCQRFCGLPRFALGNLFECPSEEDLKSAPTWRLLEERQQSVRQECAGCGHFEYCRGGCPYNALSAGKGTFRSGGRDPHCPAYRRFFDVLGSRALGEVFSERNMSAVVEEPGKEAGLLRRGALISLMSRGPHPNDCARAARRVLASVALATAGSPEQAAVRLEGLLPGVSAWEVRVPENRELVNAYLHVTFGCNQRCAHCYAGAPVTESRSMPIEQMAAACLGAAQAGFRHAVITGGEPLVHPGRVELLQELRELRRSVKPMLTVLRTNLAVQLDDALLRALAESTDEVVVSVDGDEATHDARRGAGSHRQTVANLRRLAAIPHSAALSLAAVLPGEQVTGAPGEAVRSLARELRIGRTRFRPLLPLGRALALEARPESLGSHLDPKEALASGFSPARSCGMGRNLYVEPDGGAYPCYAWRAAARRLGSIRGGSGIPGLVASQVFRELSEHTVDTNPRCRRCAVRYLCGGACRAWNRSSTDHIDAEPTDCSALHERARSLLAAALDVWQIPVVRWREAGFPWPEEPPALSEDDDVSQN
jgi:uncharacterized protein